MTTGSDASRPPAAREEIEKTTNGTRFEGGVALATGGGSGIGEAIAHRFADRGATVIVVDVDDVPPKQVASDIGRRSCR